MMPYHVTPDGTAPLRALYRGFMSERAPVRALHVHRLPVKILSQEVT